MKVIRKPFLVYAALAILTLWGIHSYKSLSVGLFPPAKRLAVNVSVSYQTYSSKQFMDTIGRDLEEQLQTFQDAQVESVIGRRIIKAMVRLFGGMVPVEFDVGDLEDVDSAA